jgi:L-serine deaminase
MDALKSDLNEKFAKSEAFLMGVHNEAVSGGTYVNAAFEGVDGYRPLVTDSRIAYEEAEKEKQT